MKSLRVWRSTRAMLHQIKEARGATSLHQALLWVSQDALAAHRCGSCLPELCMAADARDTWMPVLRCELELLDELMRLHPRQPSTRQQIAHWIVAAAFDGPAAGQTRGALPEGSGGHSAGAEPPAVGRQEVATGR